MTIRLVTFDLDGTLWPIDEVLRTAEREMRNWIRPRVPGFDGLDESELNQIRIDVLNTRPEIAHDISRLRAAILELAFQRLGLSSTESRGFAKGAFEVLINWRVQVTPFAGVQQVLEELQQHYLLATLTNGNADINATTLKHCFAFNLSAASVGALKPDPTMFNTALELAQVSPNEAVHVGDHPFDDIDAATAVGMHTVWTDYDRSRTVTNATVTVHQFDSLPDALRNLESSLE